MFPPGSCGRRSLIPIVAAADDEARWSGGHKKMGRESVENESCGTNNGRESAVRRSIFGPLHSLLLLLFFRYLNCVISSHSIFTYIDSS